MTSAEEYAAWDKVFAVLDDQDFWRPIDIRRAIISVCPALEQPHTALWRYWPLCDAHNNALHMEILKRLSEKKLRRCRKTRKADRQSRFQKQRQIKALGIPI